MVTVGAFEAKTHLAQLLKKVEKGETIVITKRGQPVAKLVPAAPAERDIRQLLQAMQEFQEQHGPTLGSGLTLRQLIEEGRR